MSAEKSATAGHFAGSRPSLRAIPDTVSPQANDTTRGAFSELPVILTLEQAAEALQIGITTARGMCRTGQLPAFKVGQQWRIPSLWLEDMLLKQK
jgi:excisionase family DNA binding protein